MVVFTLGRVIDVKSGKKAGSRKGALSNGKESMAHKTAMMKWTSSRVTLSHCLNNFSVQM